MATSSGATMQTGDGYFRCYKALHLVTYEAITCVDECVKAWHNGQKQTIPNCAATSGQCPIGKKPKPPAACQPCVSWAAALDNAAYQTNLAWPNVNPTNIWNSHVEVAKAFVLRLPKTRTTSPSAAQMADFDSASMLMVMKGFSQFHGGDRNHFDVIDKVSAIRNELSHMAMKLDMQLDVQKVKDNFKDIKALVDCLEKLHPLHFSSAKDVRDKLDQIEVEPMTDQTKKELLNDLIYELQRIGEDVKGLEEMYKMLQGRVEELEGSFLETCQATRCLDSRVGDLEVEVREARQAMHPGNEDLLPFNLEECRKALISDYMSSRGKLPLLPGMPEEFANIDELYINLKLKQKLPKESSKELDSYAELFSLKDTRGTEVKRVLMRAGPGGGKTTTVSKIAHDWAKPATEKNPKPNWVDRYTLLFAINLREVTADMSLVDAIQEQLLPRTSGKSLLSFIEANAKSIMFILDGCDEATWLTETSTSKSNDFKLMLGYKWLHESYVLVTTRPHRVPNYYNCFEPSTTQEVKLLEFHLGHVREFIARYFRLPEEYMYSPVYDWYGSPTPRSIQKKVDEVNTLWDILVKSTREKALAQIPILLTMICLLWKEEHCLPTRLTEIYEESLQHIARHNYYRNQKSMSGTDSISSTSTDEDMVEDETNSTLIGIGKVALEGLFENNGEARLVFRGDEFDRHHLSKATDLGLLSKERTRSGLRVLIRYTYLHKTFQEFSAAKYLASLLDTDCGGRFKYFMDKINSSNMDNARLVLQFCCGLSTRAARLILPQFVDLSQKKLMQLGDEARLTCEIENPWSTCLNLLAETQSKHESNDLYLCLRPLFDNQTLSVELDDDRDVLPALAYFLSCQNGDDEKSVLQSVRKAKITLRKITPLTIQVFSDLLQCMPFIESLGLIHLHDKRIKGVKRRDRSYSLTNNIGASICNLGSLQIIGFEGGGDFRNIFQVLSSQPLKSQGKIKTIELMCSHFEIVSMQRFISKLTNLRRFYLGKIYVHNREYVIGKLLQSLTSKTLQGLTVFHGPGPEKHLRLLIPTLYHLRVDGWNASDTWELFAVIHSVGKECSEDSRREELQPLPCIHLRVNNATEGIHNEAVGMLAEAFTFMPYLRILNLRGARIDEVGFACIGKALRRLTTLQELNLSNNTIGNSIKEICQSLTALTTMQKLLLRNVSLKRDGITKISTTLGHLPNLKLLNLGRNNIDVGVCVSHLFRGIQKLKCLTELNLTNVELTDKDVEDIPYRDLTNLTRLCIGGQDWGARIQHFEGLLDTYDPNHPENIARVASRITSYFQDQKFYDKYYGQNGKGWKAFQQELGEKGAQNGKYSFEGEVQYYGPRGVETVFRNLYYMVKLVHLEIVYVDVWNTWNRQRFLRECYSQCALQSAKDKHKTTNKLILEENEIKAVVDFVRSNEESS